MTVVNPITTIWASDSDANIVEPTTYKKGIGWLGGEKPPHEYFNYVLNQTDTKINELVASYLNKTEAQTLSGAMTFSGGIDMQSDIDLDGGSLLCPQGTGISDFQLILESDIETSDNTKTRLYCTPGYGFVRTVNAFWTGAAWDGDVDSVDAFMMEYVKGSTISYIRRATLPATWTSWTSYQVIHKTDPTNSDRQVAQRSAATSYFHECRAELWGVNNHTSTVAYTTYTTVSWDRELVGCTTTDVNVTATPLNATPWTVNGGPPGIGTAIIVDYADAFGCVLRSSINLATGPNIFEHAMYQVIVQK